MPPYYLPNILCYFIFLSSSHYIMLPSSSTISCLHLLFNLLYLISLSSLPLHHSSIFFLHYIVPLWRTPQMNNSRGKIRQLHDIYKFPNKWSARNIVQPYSDGHPRYLPVHINLFSHYIMLQSFLNTIISHSSIFFTNYIIRQSSLPIISCLHLLITLYHASIIFTHYTVLCSTQLRVHQRMNANGFLLPNDLFSWNK